MLRISLRKYFKLFIRMFNEDIIKDINFYLHITY